MKQQFSRYSNTWYADTLIDNRMRPPLSRNLSADVVVVGAGLAGLTTALECLNKGKSVVLLEAERVAWGASGRNGGFVIAGFAEELDQLVKKLGLEKARILYRYSQQGVKYVRRQSERLCPKSIMGTGSLYVSRHPCPDQFVSEADLLRTKFDHALNLWSAKEVRDVLKTERYFDGLYDIEAFHIHPLNYARALADEIEKLGGQIFEETRVTELEEDQNGVKCFSATHYATAENVVLCTSAYDHRLYPRLSRAILPVATYIAVTETLQEEKEQLVNTSAAIADTRCAGDYYRLINQDRLLWGGKITTQTTPPTRLKNIMQKTMSSVYPALYGVGIDYCWSGLMGYAVHKMPIIGQIKPGIWTATAFGGHGLNTTAMAGCLIAEGITGESNRWRDFADFTPKWAGGVVGKVGVQMTYWMMQGKDKFRELKSDIKLVRAN